MRLRKRTLQNVFGVYVIMRMFYEDIFSDRCMEMRKCALQNVFGAYFIVRMF